MSFVETTRQAIQPNMTPSEENFRPPVPKTLDETGLNGVQIEDMVFKLLISKGVLSGKEIAANLCLPFVIVEPILSDLKNRLMLGHRSTTGVGDFTYMLTEQGQAKGLMAREYSAYVGAAPVQFADYLKSIEAQSIRNENPGVEAMECAFHDMVLDPDIFNTIGPAVNSGRGLFLYGEPGNGKTSLAERIPQCFQHDIYIPKTLLIDGQLVKLYDPQCHESVEPDPKPLIADFDQRWVKIRRPVVVVGGELTMDSLEIKYNELIKVSEAPLQMKANCGVFLIDDFGRQRVHHTDLLNRWIVPLEKRIDFLTLPNGKKIEVPFDELIIFSTNIDPKDLVDDAFLRRIPYKIHVKDPTETEFRNLFKFLAPRYNIQYDDAMVTYLIEAHYKGKRPFRCCQARDILEQIVNATTYKRAMPAMTKELLDSACANYFAAMGNI